jgi:truncated hemoglobin YjbI
VVKDLSQFDYSLRRLQVAEAERSAWLERYAAARGDGTTPATYRSAIARKVARIARHDARLNRRQPNRNVSIPGQPA